MHSNKAEPACADGRFGRGKRYAPSVRSAKKVTLYATFTLLAGFCFAFGTMDQSKRVPLFVAVPATIIGLAAVVWICVDALKFEVPATLPWKDTARILAFPAGCTLISIGTHELNARGPCASATVLLVLGFIIAPIGFGGLRRAGNQRRR